MSDSYTPAQRLKITEKLQILCNYISEKPGYSIGIVEDEGQSLPFAVHYPVKDKAINALMAKLAQIDIGRAVEHVKPASAHSTIVLYPHVPFGQVIAKLEEAANRTKIPQQIAHVINLSSMCIDSQSLSPDDWHIESKHYPKYTVTLKSAGDNAAIINVMEEALEGNVANIKRVSPTQLQFTVAQPGAISEMEQAIAYVKAEIVLKKNPWTERVQLPKDTNTRAESQNDEEFSIDYLKNMFGAKSAIVFHSAAGKEPAYISIRPSEPRDVVERESLEQLSRIADDKYDLHEIKTEDKEKEIKFEIKVFLSPDQFRRRAMIYESLQRDFMGSSLPPAR